MPPSSLLRSLPSSYKPLRLFLLATDAVLDIWRRFLVSARLGNCLKLFTFLFPSTLEVLHFTHCHWHNYHLLLALQDLLRHKSEHVPLLSEVILEGDIIEGDLCQRGEGLFEEQIVSLLTQGRKQDVVVTLLNRRLDEKKPDRSISSAQDTDFDLQWSKGWDLDWRKLLGWREETTERALAELSYAKPNLHSLSPFLPST